MNLNLPADCEHFARCGETGHFVNEQGGVERCPCLVRKQNGIYLKEFDCAVPKMDTEMVDNFQKNMVLEGTREAVVRHTAGAFLHLKEQNRVWLSVTSERLLEIWLGNDEDGVRTFVPLERADLVFLWLGWGDTLPNKCRPDAIDDLISRRARLQRPLWVYMNFDYKDVGTRYNSAKLARKMEDSFERVDLELKCSEFSAA